MQEILVYSGSNRLWGSNDCKKDAGRDVRTLAPGKAVTVSTRWGAQTSIPGCSIGRLQVGVGAYPITAHLGTLSQSNQSMVVITG